MRFTARWYASATLLVLLGLSALIVPGAAAQRPKPSPAPVVKTPTAAPAPVPALLPTPAAATVAVRTAFRGALAQPRVRASVRTEILRQLSASRTVGMLDGAWATPLDIGRLYNLPPRCGPPC